jgi:hypothetical protein
MGTIIGRQIELGVAKETVRGTAKTTADRWLRKVTASIFPKSEIAVDDTSRATFEDAEGSRVTRTWYEGDLEGILHADMLGYFLMNLYGTVNTAAATGTAKNHTFSMLQTPFHPSYTFFLKDGSVVQETISLGMFKSLSVMAKTDDYLRFKASMIGAVGAANAASPTYGTDFDFISRDIVIKMASTSGGLSGATAIPVKEMSIDWKQTLTPSFVFGGYPPTDILNSDFSIEGKFTLDFADTTYRALLTTDTQNYMQIVITGAAIVGGGSSNPKLDLTLNKVQVMDWNRGGGANELVSQEFTFKAFYNAADGKMSTPIVTSGTAAH